ncbi:MAG: type II toxin-antitoxin system HicA family toxin [Gammaproteobacteria bacterium]|nr:type II toxin-antitoxin system HicA family toxin [Gammaproteobacteria bacterium]MDE0450142.1 type II toxin-antitoxin system HicA family toxin [Gammaproteobacteria bacterium]
MKVREVIRILEDNGFRFVRQTGSHRRFNGMVHGQTRHVTIAGKESDDVTKPTLVSIRRQSGLTRSEFRPR